MVFITLLSYVYSNVVTIGYEYIFISIVPIILFVIISYLFSLFDYIHKYSKIKTVKISFLDEKSIKRNAYINVHESIENNVISLFETLQDVEYKIEHFINTPKYGNSSYDYEFYSKVNYSFGSYFKLDKNAITSNTYQSFGLFLSVNPKYNNIVGTKIELIFNYYGWQWNESEKGFIFTGK